MATGRLNVRRRRAPGYVYNRLVEYGMPLSEQEESVLAMLLERGCGKSTKALSPSEKNVARTLRIKLGYATTIAMVVDAWQTGAAALLLATRADVEAGKLTAQDPARQYVAPAAERMAWLRKQKSEEAA